MYSQLAMGVHDWGVGMHSQPWACLTVHGLADLIRGNPRHPRHLFSIQLDADVNSFKVSICALDKKFHHACIAKVSRFLTVQFT